jgi:hypothetical protein
LVVWTGREGTGDVEVEIGDVGTSRKKGDDRGLGKSASAALEKGFWLWGLTEPMNPDLCRQGAARDPSDS